MKNETPRNTLSPSTSLLCQGHCLWELLGLYKLVFCTNINFNLRGTFHTDWRILEIRKYSQKKRWQKTGKKGWGGDETCSIFQLSLEKVKQRWQNKRTSPGCWQALSFCAVGRGLALKFRAPAFLCLPRCVTLYPWNVVVLEM